jgi:hypothetical protein
VEYHQYYDNMSKEELDHNPWLIVIIEAAWYCESRHEDYIKRSSLKRRSNKILNRITEGRTHTSLDLGGTFETIISKLSKGPKPKKDRFLTRVNKDKRKKDSRIYPNIKLIQNEVKNRQAENLDNGIKTLIRLRYKIDSVHHPRFIIEPSLATLESVIRRTAKTRCASDSLTLSDGVGMVVTHASSNEVPN